MSLLGQEQKERNIGFSSSHNYNYQQNPTSSHPLIVFYFGFSSSLLAIFAILFYTFINILPFKPLFLLRNSRYSILVVIVVRCGLGRHCYCCLVSRPFLFSKNFLSSIAYVGYTTIRYFLDSSNVMV